MANNDPNQTKLARSIVLLSLLSLWVCQDAIPWVGQPLLRLGGAFVLIAAARKVICSANVHAAIWFVSLTAAGVLLYQAIGEPPSPHGGLAAGYAFLTLTYALLAYVCVAAALAWFDLLFKFFWCFKNWRTGFGPTLALRLLAIVSCLCFATWSTWLAAHFYNGSISLDAQYAFAQAGSRMGTPIDPVLEEQGERSDLAFALAVSTTRRSCPGVGIDDRVIVLDAHRIFVTPALRKVSRFETSTTYPLSGSKIKKCENVDS
jgi:hypothetical protein